MDSGGIIANNKDQSKMELSSEEKPIDSSASEKENKEKVDFKVVFNKKKFDVFWEAPGVSQINVFDFRKADKLFQMGYDYAQSQVDILRSSLSKMETA